MIDRKDITKVSLGLAAIVIIAVIAGIVGRVESSFHNGVNLDAPISTSQEEIEWDLPEINWIRTDAEVKWNDVLKEKVAKDYLKAWKSYNNATFSEDYTDLKDYFDEVLIDKILQQSDKNTAKIKQINLSHNLVLKHLSKDYAVVVFEDKEIRVISQVTKSEGVYEQIEKVYSLDVKMALQDGNWKVYNWTPIENSSYVATSITEKPDTFKMNMDRVANAQGVNYYPQETPWLDFWGEYDSLIIDRDMQIIKEIGFNTVRIFISMKDLGRNKIKIKTIEKLDNLLAIAASYDLYVIPTLFDFNIGYDLAKYPSYHRQLSYLLDRYHDNTTIIAWDIKNEPDLDFEQQGRDAVINWCDFLIKEAHEMDIHHPVTIGWSSTEAAVILMDAVDFVSMHHYKDFNDLEQFNKQMKSQNKLFVIEEFGKSSNSSIWNANMGSQDRQAKEINTVVQYANAEKIPWLVWTLYDYKRAPSEVFGWKPWIKSSQKEFGLIDTSGFLKMSGSQLQSQLK